MFIGNISPNYSDVDIQSYFSRFGVVEKVEIFPRTTQEVNLDNYALVQYVSQEDASNVLRMRKDLYIAGKRLSCAPFKIKSKENEGYFHKNPATKELQNLSIAMKSFTPVFQLPIPPSQIHFNAPLLLVQYQEPTSLQYEIKDALLNYRLNYQYKGNIYPAGFC